jgi:hypothetical protein
MRNSNAHPRQNFFSTQFVHTDDNGKLQVSPDAWLLAAIAVPLTAITLLLWLGWVYYTRMATDSMLQPSVRSRIRHRVTLRSFRSWRKASATDLEGGTFSKASEKLKSLSLEKSFWSAPSSGKKS